MPRTVQDSAGRVKILALRSRVMSRYTPRALDFFDSLGTVDGKYYPGFNSGDGIHTNNRGHQLLFNRVVAANLTAIPTVLAGDFGSRPVSSHGSRTGLIWDERLGILTLGRPGAGGHAVEFDAQGRQRLRL